MSWQPTSALTGPGSDDDHARSQTDPPDGRSTTQHESLTRSALRRSTHDDLMALTLSFADEFSGRVPLGTVIRSVTYARERLLAAGVRAGLVVAVESMTRARLERPASGTVGGARTPEQGGPEVALIAHGWVR